MYFAISVIIKKLDTFGKIFYTYCYACWKIAMHRVAYYTVTAVFIYECVCNTNQL